jgi:uncharacterized protein
VRGVVAFLALTFAVTWACFIPAAVLSGRLSISDPASGLRALILLGTISPSLIALALTGRAEGAAGMRALLRRVLQWQVSARYYVFAVGYMAAVKLTAAAAHRFVTGSWPRFWEEPWYVMAAAITISTWVQAGEEIGWRGYALPRLAARWGLATGSIVLGVIWAVWHLPLFYLHGADTYGQSFAAYLLQVVAISIAMAWLYWRTHGSLLLVMLMHASINNTKGIVPTVPRLPADPLWPGASLTAWLTVAALWAVAAPILIRMQRGGPRRASPGPVALDR